MADHEIKTGIGIGEGTEILMRDVVEILFSFFKLFAACEVLLAQLAL
jgi:hypothetical protein